MENENKDLPPSCCIDRTVRPRGTGRNRGGDYVLAQKKADKAWYHGRVTTVRARTQDRRNATYDVALGDYTAEEDIPWRNITVLKAHLADCEDAPDYSRTARTAARRMQGRKAEATTGARGLVVTSIMDRANLWIGAAPAAAAR